MIFELDQLLSMLGIFVSLEKAGLDTLQKSLIVSRFCDSIKWLSFIHGMIIWKSLGKHKLIKVILKLQIDKLKIHIEIAILLL